MDNVDLNRLVIDTIKQSFSDYVATGEVDSGLIAEAQACLSREYDRMKPGKIRPSSKH